jgi:FtsP/CotA-like multicopper oxidase with cupredoxin domain
VFARRLAILTAAVALGAGACGDKTPFAASGEPPPVPPPAGWDDGIRPPPVVDLNPDPNIVEIDIEAKVAPIEVMPGTVVDMWTYNGGVPGPLIRVPRGGRLIVHFTNNLPEDSTIHWHGVRVPAAMDGVPGQSQDPVPPGGTFDYDFTVPDAGLFWYHPHVDSAAQVGDGLYGALLVDARPEDAGAEHPADPPDLGPELVLVLSDVGILNGALEDPNSGGDLGTLFGREGNVVLVNGRVGPTVLARRGQRQRWRIVNAAKSRYFQLAMAGHTFTQIGSDGGLIPAAQDLQMPVLAPGERADLLVTPQGDPGTSVPVRWVPFDRGFGSTEFRPEVESFYVRLTDDDPITDPPAALPATLRAIAPLDLSGVTTTRTLTLTQMYDASDKLVLGIDGIPSWDAEPLHAHVGDTEQWIITHPMDWDHPIHLHGFFFQEVDPRTNTPLLATGWKDTFNVPRQQTKSFVVRYDNRTGMWMFHCHILDHADAGMMGMLMLMPTP